MDILDKLSAADPMYPDYIPDSVLVNNAGQFIGNGHTVFYLVMGANDNNVFASGNLKRLKEKVDGLMGNGLKPFLRKLSDIAGDNLLVANEERAVARLVQAMKVVAKGKRHPTKSWTQEQVNEHIAKLRDTCNFPGGFDKLVSACNRRLKGAMEKACNEFGQRHLMAAMQLSSSTFLARSEVYQDIRRQLPCLGKTGRPKNVGYGIGADLAAISQWKDNKRLEAEADAILKAGKRLP